MTNKIIVRPETFSILKTRKPLKNALANIDDGNEKTSIIDESGIKDKRLIINEENGYKLITFDMVLSFDTVGFLAKISKALAGENIPIFAISAYSTDHILVKKNHLESAVSALKKLGFEAKWKTSH